MVNIGKWYSKAEYYNEEGIQITKREAERHYIKIATYKYIKIDGNTGYIEYWHRCQRTKQTELF